MAIRKSEPYPSLCSSYDELHGSMDASQYRDYVLIFFLFLINISDKYGGIAKITNFQDIVVLKSKTDISDQINRKIIEPFATGNLFLLTANHELMLSIQITLRCRFKGCIDSHHGTCR